ncbi:MAG TPA: DUF4406 domain-containing protein [Oscillospiraceae bacterium]|nr:DUF4406 domain-containing protein [Oscillospiraceae bacterium]HRW57816.1 DUF4406 domain-containing protein [Oscillospiraceae bacterium]
MKEYKLPKGTAERIRAEAAEVLEFCTGLPMDGGFAVQATQELQETIRAAEQGTNEKPGTCHTGISTGETMKRCCGTCEWYWAVNPQSTEKHCVKEYDPSACMECRNWEPRGTEGEPGRNDDEPQETIRTAEQGTGEKETVYLAGRITGDPCYFSKFYAADQKLKAAGFIVLDPAMLPGEGFSHEAYMRMTTAMLDECSAVCFLSDWRESRGAIYEHARATVLGKRIFYFDEWKDEKTKPSPTKEMA